MTRLKLKEKLDELYSRMEETEDTLRSELRKMEEYKDEIGRFSDELDEPLEPEPSTES